MSIAMPADGATILSGVNIENNIWVYNYHSI